MSTYQSESGNSSTSQLNLETDVLVISNIRNEKLLNNAQVRDFLNKQY
ncbi:MAG: hypothetical protein V7K77_03275 [Nostoc sp.]